MNEVRQHWASLKTPRSSIVVSGNSTWYDVPAPVIVHGRSFHEDPDSDLLPVIHEIPVAKLEDRINEADQTHYPNNVEAKLNGINDHRLGEHREDWKDATGTIEDQAILLRQNSGKKRHSSSIELTAATKVETDADGIPTITFSFFRTDERLETERREIDQVDGVNQLYDFPRSTRSEANLASFESASDLDCAPPVAPEPSEAAELSRDDLYDVVGERSSNRDDELPTAVTSEKTFQSRRGSSSKSLKWRRSLGKLEDLVRSSHSGSHSDSEAPATRKWPARSHRKLGKAWDRMRTWLSEERSRLGDVVARHARLQAVGARLDDVAEEVGRIGAQTGSYDLTRARVRQDEGALPRVEEFGLGLARNPVDRVDQVDEVDGPPESASLDTRPGSEQQLAGETTRIRITRISTLQYSMKKTASSDDILAGESTREKPPATSFSLERLCSADEAEEEEEEEGTPATTTDRLGSIETKRREKRRRAKPGLIKRRMLGSIRGLIASTHLLHETEESGPGGFEEVRRYVKQGGDFCKELAAILHERAELEATYAKGLSKLSGKLTKACAKDQGGNSGGGVSEAWRSVGEEMEAAAEAHRAWGSALGEQLAKPLRVGVAEVQGRTRKSIENSVDKASKSLQEWRTVAAKTKKQSFTCARENERLQDLARLQSLSQSHQQQQQQQQQSNNKLASNGHHHHHHHGHHMTEKEASKLETRRRKAEDSARRADTEFYTVTVRAERARLEYECAVRKAAKQMELLEEERLSALKDLANVYLAHLQALAPKLQQSADRLSQPIRNSSVAQDVEILKNLIRRIDSNDSSSTEQLLPDFYAEHVTLAMNRERRKQALVRVLHLIRQDLERERRGREGLETLHRAFIKTPAFAADESTQNVTDKLLHMRSMLTYLEAARYKVGGALSELEGGKRGKHPLAEHILVSRDKQGLQQSVLKVPSWVRNESFELQDNSDGELEVLHLSKESEVEQRDWADRTAGDGNSENPPDEEDFSDFDEFSSNSEDNNNHDVDSADVSVAGKTEDGLERCRAIYQYSANLNDELSLNPGDLITVHEKQADGWWIGECRGRTGIFPATYVQVIN